MNEERICPKCRDYNLQTANFPGVNCDKCYHLHNKPYFYPAGNYADYESPIIDEIMNTITPEEQAKCNADMVEMLERKAALAAWMEARHRYSGVVGGEKPAEMAFEKWYDQWKEAAQ